MKNYDRNKFVVLVSAGPTARRVIASNKYYTCGVNVCPKLIEKTDFWIVNDACYFQDFTDIELSTIKNLALPEFPHTVNGVNYKPESTINYKKATENLPNHINIYPFNIHTSRKFNLPYNPNILYFEARSSNESAVRWLISQGFKKFVSLGQDPDGNYHKTMFSRPTAYGGKVVIKKTLDNNRYTKVQKKIKQIIHENDALMIRLVIPENQNFSDEKFLLFSDLVDAKGYYEVENK